MKKGLCILGSTGSIGTQALEVVRENPDKFQVQVLSAGNNHELLLKQALEFQPFAVVINNPAGYDKIHDTLFDAGIKCYCGNDALKDLVAFDSIDLVLTAMVGAAGLEPTVAAIEAKKAIALANKETLVVAGSFISKLAIENRVPIIPVDSEHSAIFQCLTGEGANEIEKLILTASGGPFRGYSLEQLKGVTKAQALKHPNWAMGAKITIDSATMMNKGLEVIEARWLFDTKGKDIEVVVHPESIVHSLVQFTDGSIKAQLGLPDMKLPIQYAFAYPKRIENQYPRFTFAKYPALHFEEPDTAVFQNLDLAFKALEDEVNMPAVLNAANEVAVAQFLEEKISFLNIGQINAEIMEQYVGTKSNSIQDVIALDKQVRISTQELIKKKF